MELDIKNLPLIDLIELWDILTEKEKELAIKRLYKENEEIEQ